MRAKLPNWPGYCRCRSRNQSRARIPQPPVADVVTGKGAGYRVYLGLDGNALVILLGGATKKRQQSDIERATALWAEYKARKATER